jgi:hypothetical protein
MPHFGAVLLVATVTQFSVSIGHEGMRQRDLQCQKTQNDGARTLPAAREYRIDKKTEIYLDGRRCQWNEVSPNAIINRMTVAPDCKTILLIEFRTDAVPSRPVPKS